MDNKNSSLITDELRKQIFHDLADQLIKGLETGQLSVEEGRPSSQFILDRLNKAKTQEELTLFFEELGKKWSIYNTVYLQNKAMTNQKEDQSKLNEIKNKINTFIITK